MITGTPLLFHRQGTRGAHAACAAAVAEWQPVSVACPRCGARYIASVERREPEHSAAEVEAYPDLVGQALLAERRLASECPDHGARLRVRPFTVVPGLRRRPRPVDSPRGQG